MRRSRKPVWAYPSIGGSNPPLSACDESGHVSHVSRDIGLSWGSSASGRAVCSVAPVGLVGLDEMGREDFAGGEVGDGDVVVVGERQDACAGVADADAEVVHAAGAAQGHAAFAVEPVVAQSVVPGVVSVAGGDGFGGRAVDLAGGAAVQGAVRAALVVVLAELLQLPLKLGQGPGGWSGREPALQGLVKALSLALRLGVRR